MQCSIKYNILYEWSFSMITVALSFENVCEIYTLDDTLDGAREGLEKCLATNVYK